MAKRFNQYDPKIVEAERLRVTAILNKWVGRIGGGFHPDTAPDEYEPKLSMEDGLELSRDLQDVDDTCCTHGLDMYELAMSTEEWKKVHPEE